MGVGKKKLFSTLGMACYELRTCFTYYPQTLTFPISIVCEHALCKASHTTMNAGGTRGVYVLELQRGFFYVGKSHDIQRRIAQHTHGQQAALWCKKYGPMIAVHAPLTPEKEDMDTWEMDEVIARMLKHGFHCVRGWQILDAEENLSLRSYYTVRNLIIGKKDFCMFCGFPGHFGKNCSKKFVENKAAWLQKLEACCPSLHETMQPKIAVTKQSPHFSALASFKHSHCFRCGRYGHWVKDCFAKTHSDGFILQE
jgi:predicted GIY-YIG superfamily endonuclease